MRRTHAVTRAGQRHVGIVLLMELGQAKIRDLHSIRWINQDVFRLNVAMDDAVVMCVPQSFADLAGDSKRAFRREWTDRKSLPQIWPLDEFHDKIVISFRHPGVERHHDALMFEPREYLGFA